jgi:hypothetical protein
MGHIYVQMRKIMDPSCILIPGGLPLLMANHHQQELKYLLSQIYILMKDGFSSKLKTHLRVTEGDIASDSYEIHLEIDINKDYEFEGRHIWKQRVVEK